MNELEELRLEAYESSKIYKDQTKKWHDAKIVKKDTGVGNLVLLFNSKVKVFPGKLRSRWSGPFKVMDISPYDTFELWSEEGGTFKVNEQRVKRYYDGDDKGLIEVFYLRKPLPEEESRIDGNTYTEPKDIQQAFLNYYMQLLGKIKPISKVHGPTVRTGKLIEEHHCRALLKPGLLGPGRGDITAAVIDFFHSSQLLKQLNTTTITLIPKFRSPTSVTEFRPITCCNILYKCITKILCNRLGEVLPELIYDLLLFSKGTDTSIMWMLRGFATFSATTGLQLNRDKSDIYFNGVSTEVMGNIMQISGFRKGTLPFKYLGVPISSKKLTKNEGNKLTDRLVARTRAWGSRHLSYAALLGKYTLWLAAKKDHLWVRWINHVYMKDGDWQNYKAPNDSSWSWKKIVQIKDTLKKAYSGDLWLNGTTNYTTTEGCKWLRTHKTKVPWRHLCWKSLNVPRCSFIFWACVQGKLLTRDRLLRMGFGQGDDCYLCGGCAESHNHLFYQCPYSNQCMRILKHMLHCSFPVQRMMQWYSSGRGRSKLQSKWIAACFVGLTYAIWRERNLAWQQQVRVPKLIVIQSMQEVKARWKKMNSSTLKQKDRAWIDLIS
ncbi:uncharacterized protein LOC141614663 [Silene latifolia]|uniref:uncharacterized protein LOC141614663 n=1 Tax=Silene latifolia TaxID=37657 RepID=UPI003D779AC8